mmetsp:Transcript_4954/g.7513  ORF Transcript_4954/g.7513 Transcript_4954/m.7513 type:complete len:386 (+) Transcript_4954:1476-2633(+)
MHAFGDSSSDEEVDTKQPPRTNSVSKTGKVRLTAGKRLSSIRRNEQLKASVQDDFNGPSPSCTLCTGPLGTNTWESSLLAVFQKYGPISKVRVETCGEDNARKGYVTFNKLVDAKRAFSVLDGTAVKDSHLRLCWVARPDRDLNEIQLEGELEQGDNQASLRLSSTKEAAFKDILERASLTRASVCSAMFFCIEHSEWAEHCSELLCDSFEYPSKGTDVTPPRMIARLYILSDLLNNTSANVRNVSTYRMRITPRLPKIFQWIGTLRRSEMCGKILTAEMDRRIERVFLSWKQRFILSPVFLRGLESTYYDVFPSHLPTAETLAMSESDLRRVCCAHYGLVNDHSVPRHVLEKRLTSVKSELEDRETDSVDGDPLVSSDFEEDEA